METGAIRDQASKSWPGEHLAKENWKSDKKLRNEFAGDLDSYLAYQKAMDLGLVKKR